MHAQIKLSFFRKKTKNSFTQKMVYQKNCHCYCQLQNHQDFFSENSKTTFWQKKNLDKLPKSFNGNVFLHLTLLNIQRVFLNIIFWCALSGNFNCFSFQNDTLFHLHCIWGLNTRPLGCESSALTSLTNVLKSYKWNLKQF